MAFPTQDTRAPLWLLFQNAQYAASGLKRLADSSVTALSVTARAGIVLEIAEQLRSYRATLMTAANASGMAAWVAENVSGPGIDVAAEFTAMLAASDAVRDWVIANFPKDDVAPNYLLRETIDATGHTTERTFTAAQTAQLRTLLTALSATIA